MVLFRLALVGVTGWLLRLVFAAAVVVGAYGLYLASFASLGRPDPGHDRLAGTIVMAVALGVSLVCFIALAATPALRETVGLAWYASTYLMFAVLFVTTLLPLSASLRMIGDWQRSNTQVTASVFDCYEDRSDSGSEDYCTYRWTAGGQAHEQKRTADQVYPDGTQVPLWVDPNTGGADDHSLFPIVFGFAVAAFDLLFDGLALWGAVSMISNRWRGPRAWLADLAWWRPARPTDVGGPPTESAASEAAREIADAVPPQAQSGAVEDARPPGYE